MPFVLWILADTRLAYIITIALAIPIRVMYS
nr:MAG TPA_asm: hypothetical protein [Caudoviricetes sp.]